MISKETVGEVKPEKGNPMSNLKEQAHKWQVGKYRMSDAVPQADKIIQDLLATVEHLEEFNRKANTEIARLNKALSEGVPILEEAATRIEKLELSLGYVCNGCEVPCRLDTSGKPFDSAEAVCFIDGCRTGTDWKVMK